MIRLTIEQLKALRDSIQAGGQVHCAVLPLVATYAHSLIIAWAKGRSEGEQYYLSVWRDTKSLDKARQEEEEGKRPPYDFLNDPQSADYTHTYPVEEDTTPYQLAITKTGRIRCTDEYSPSAADSGHPEFGVLRE